MRLSSVRIGPMKKHQRAPVNPSHVATSQSQLPFPQPLLEAGKKDFSSFLLLHIAKISVVLNV